MNLATPTRWLLFCHNILLYSNMEIFDSTPYVIVRAKRLAPYFAKRNWFVTAGKSNSILINIMEDAPISYDAEQLAQIITETDMHIKETGLPVNDIEYIFYHNGRQYESFTIFDVRDFDVWIE